METFSLYSYSASAIAYFLFLCLLLIRVKRNPLDTPALIAIFFSLIWSGYTVYILQNSQFYIQDILPFELLRNLAWFFFLSVLISKQQFNNQYFLLLHSWQVPVMLVFTSAIFVLELFSEIRHHFQQFIGFDFRHIVHIGFSIIGLILVEQLYRNAMQEQRWAIKFICMGLASVFTIDFILYSKSILFNTLDGDLWATRGIINAAIVPLFAISLNRLSIEKVRVHVSNKVIFHTTVLLGAGLYLLLMSLAGYYIRIYGGNWGAIVQISFIFLAIIMLLIFFVSGKIRALAKVYFSKHFFQSRYDYREEWVKLSKKLAVLHSIEDISYFIVDTMANCIDSTGGGLWVKNDQGDYFLSAEQNLGEHSLNCVQKYDPLLLFLNEKQWVIDFIEFFNDPDIYAGAELERWYNELDEIWLIIPLFQQNSLEAFVILTQPRASRQIDWEDHDLLKTVGMQLANALALSKTSDDLSRSRQFEAYNRFSAFLVHDLKNLVAQISLIVRNAEKHKRNPDFIDDSVETLEHVVKKIEHILGQLKKGNSESKNQTKINLVGILKEVEKQQAANTPVLAIDIDAEEYWLTGEKDKMIAIVGHLVQNAQEATDDNGSVKIEVKKKNQQIIIKIIDTGSGMDKKFIQQRLFKPFDTTKGNAGMGIGVYEAREYILQQAGKISVESEPGVGTTFTIILPEAS